MTEKKNIHASVHQRLYNHAKNSGEDFNLLLTRFANERFLYRLSISGYKDHFLLKGASSLFTFWFEHLHRPTRVSNFTDLIASLGEFFTKIIEAENEKQPLVRHWQKGTWR